MKTPGSTMETTTETGDCLDKTDLFGLGHFYKGNGWGTVCRNGQQNASGTVKVLEGEKSIADCSAECDLMGSGCHGFEFCKSNARCELQIVPVLHVAMQSSEWLADTPDDFQCWVKSFDESAGSATSMCPRLIDTGVKCHGGEGGPSRRRRRSRRRSLTKEAESSIEHEDQPYFLGQNGENCISACARRFHSLCDPQALQDAATSTDNCQAVLESVEVSTHMPDKDMNETGKTVEMGCAYSEKTKQYGVFGYLSDKCATNPDQSWRRVCKCQYGCTAVEFPERPFNIEDLPLQVTCAHEKLVPGAKITAAKVECEDFHHGNEIVYEVMAEKCGREFESEITPHGKVMECEDQGRVGQEQVQEEEEEHGKEEEEEPKPQMLYGVSIRRRSRRRSLPKDWASWPGVQNSKNRVYRATPKEYRAQWQKYRIFEGCSFGDPDYSTQFVCISATVTDMEKEAFLVTSGADIMWTKFGEATQKKKNGQSHWCFAKLRAYFSQLQLGDRYLKADLWRTMRDDPKLQQFWNRMSPINPICKKGRRGHEVWFRNGNILADGSPAFGGEESKTLWLSSEARALLRKEIEYQQGICEDFSEQSVFADAIDEVADRLDKHINKKTPWYLDFAEVLLGFLPIPVGPILKKIVQKVPLEKLWEKGKDKFGDAARQFAFKEAITGQTAKNLKKKAMSFAKPSEDSAKEAARSIIHDRNKFLDSLQAENRRLYDASLNFNNFELLMLQSVYTNSDQMDIDTSYDNGWHAGRPAFSCSRKARKELMQSLIYGSKRVDQMGTHSLPWRYYGQVHKEQTAEAQFGVFDQCWVRGKDKPGAVCMWWMITVRHYLHITAIFVAGYPVPESWKERARKKAQQTKTYWMTPPEGYQNMGAKFEAVPIEWRWFVDKAKGSDPLGNFN
jgi:hypothetical protein